MTRSPGRIGLSCRNIRASASTKAAALRWLTATPLGVPVEPDVKMTQASSVRSGSSSGAGSATSSVERMTRSAVTTAATPASSKTRRARSSGSSWSTGHVGGAGEQDADDRHVEVGRAGRDAHPDPVAAADALVAQGGGDLAGGREQLVVGEHLAAVVDRRRVGVVVGGGAQHVDEGARRGARSARSRGSGPGPGWGPRCSWWRAGARRVRSSSAAGRGGRRGPGPRG